MELWAFYITILAVIVAIPGTIDATWNVILKLRALKKEHSPLPAPPSKKASSGIPNTKQVSFPRSTLAILKKLIRGGHDHAQRLLLLKKATLFHLQTGIRITCFAVLAVTSFALVSLPPPTVFAPTEDLKAAQSEQDNFRERGDYLEEALRLYEEAERLSGTDIYKRWEDSDEFKRALDLLKKSGYKKTSLWILYHEIAHLTREV